MTSLLNVININQLVQKILSGIHTDGRRTDRQNNDIKKPHFLLMVNGLTSI
jgi:hypothetical protein